MKICYRASVGLVLCLPLLPGCGQTSRQSALKDAGVASNPDPKADRKNAAPTESAIQAKSDLTSPARPSRLSDPTIELLRTKGVRVDPLRQGFDPKEGYEVIFEDKAFGEDGTVKPEIAELLKPGARFKEFAFGEVPISDAGFAQLQSFPPVAKISVHQLSRITDNAFAGLRIKGLQRLSLSQLMITDKGLANLKTFPDLQEISIDECPNITDEALVYLKDLPKLKKLHYYPLKIGTYSLTDTTLEKIADLASLEELEFPPEGPNRANKDGYKFTDNGLEHLRRLKKLKAVHLPWCNHITATGANHLTSLPDLERLGLPFCEHIDDKALAGLKNCPKLRILDLSGTHITDAGLVHLKPLASLDVLSLDWTAIGDAGIKQLTGLKQVSSLNIRDTKVTKQGVEALKKAKPDLFISE